MVEETTKEKTAEERRTDDNIILVGNKPLMNYVLAVVAQFNKGLDKVIIKARGRTINNAVDTVEIVRNRFIKDAEVKDINIGTESLNRDEGGTSNMSTIEIYLTKKEEKNN